MVSTAFAAASAASRDAAPSKTVFSTNTAGPSNSTSRLAMSFARKRKWKACVPAPGAPGPGAGPSPSATSGTKICPGAPVRRVRGAESGGVSCVSSRTQRSGIRLSNFFVPVARNRRSGSRTTTKSRW